MNIGQIASTTSCCKCHNFIKITPLQENATCEVCGTLNDLKMRDFTKEESLLHSESVASMFKPTGRNIMELCEDENVTDFGKMNIYWCRGCDNHFATEVGKGKPLNCPVCLQQKDFVFVKEVKIAE